MTDKTLQELEAYKDRLEKDIRRSRLVDSTGLTRTSPLVKNHLKVVEDIKKLKENKDNG